LTFLVLLLAAAGDGSSLWAAPLPPVAPEPLRQQARDFESRGQWALAAEVWALLGSKDRDVAEYREGYQRCLRHVHQARRLRDREFQDDILNRPFADALRVYVEVIEQVQANYADKRLATPSRLFQEGLQEFIFALQDPEFGYRYLNHVSAYEVQEFMARIGQWPIRPTTLEDARRQVQNLALEAGRELRLNPSVVVLEFACGACNGLDEYTVCLTPAQLKEIQPLLQGHLIGIGVELEQDTDGGKQGYVVSQVHPESPAQNRLAKGDRLTRIDGQPVERLPVDLVNSKLRGEAGMAVTLDVVPAGEKTARSIKLERRVYPVRTVTGQRLLDEGIGYVRLTGFHKNTPQDLREALLDLQTKGMKVLVLDLRDNDGGLFLLAIEVSRMFLAEGMIASTQSQADPNLNRTYRSRNPQAYTMPLVVIINGLTASAAEVLAGALKDNHRGTVVGQSSFGKGSIQYVVPLKGKDPQKERPLLGAIRITVAKFFSPTNQPYSGRGITPDYPPVELEGTAEDAFVNAALLQARFELSKLPRPTMNP
jgi:carboxyl-terminal processing protease